MKKLTIKTGGSPFGIIMKQLAQQDLRYQPLYTLSEVSRYARVKPATLRSWTHNGDAHVIIPANVSGVAPFSFINLIELYIMEALRNSYHVPLQRIRPAVEWLRQKYGIANPLAAWNLETDGYDLFIRELGIPIDASRKGQGGFPEVLARYLQRIDRDVSKVPTRFYPYTFDRAPKIIVMDPAVAYGRPVVLGTRVTSQMIFDRYSGGESLNDIAVDYDIDISLVEEALRCEIERIAA